MEKTLLTLFKSSQDENVKRQLGMILYDVIKLECPSCKQETKLVYFQNEWGRKADTCYECRRDAFTQSMEEYLANN